MFLMYQYITNTLLHGRANRHHLPNGFGLLVAVNDARDKSLAQSMEALRAGAYSPLEQTSTN